MLRLKANRPGAKSTASYSTSYAANVNVRKLRVSNQWDNYAPVHVYRGVTIRFFGTFEKVAQPTYIDMYIYARMCDSVSQLCVYMCIIATV